MPSFMMAVGFSYRLTTLRRLAQQGPVRTYGHVLIRSLALVLISLVMYASEDIHQIKDWSELTPGAIWELIGGLLKANLWEVLAIIGVTQILIMPVIAASVRVRNLAWIGCAVVHLILSYLFNFAFVYGSPNGVDRFLGLTGSGLGRWLLRSDRLGDPDAVWQSGLRRRVEPNALERNGTFARLGDRLDGLWLRPELPGNAV